jgi:antirestriction protein ArdC
MTDTTLSNHPDSPNSPTTKTNTVYQMVTDKILALLAKGTVPWRRTWRLTFGNEPVNVRGTDYRGANYFLLSALGYERPIFLTFKQALELGGSVKRGEHGIPVVYWKMLEAKDSDDNEPYKDKRKLIPLLRYFTVFNVEQCENLKLPARFTETKEPPSNINPILEAESIWENYQNPPTLRFGGNRAVYRSNRDEIVMPGRHTFESPEEYYSVLYHEMGHSSGHKSRLNRDLGMQHGHKAYAREELIAEMCSAFLCAKAGISQPVIENQAAYLSEWSAALKDDVKLFVTAAGKAQKAADWVLGAGATYEGEELCA